MNFAEILATNPGDFDEFTSLLDVARSLQTPFMVKDIAVKRAMVMARLIDMEWKLIAVNDRTYYFTKVYGDGTSSAAEVTELDPLTSRVRVVSPNRQHVVPSYFTAANEGKIIPIISSAAELAYFGTHWNERQNVHGYSVRYVAKGSLKGEIPRIIQDVDPLIDGGAVSISSTHGAGGRLEYIYVVTPRHKFQIRIRNSEIRNEVTICFISKVKLPLIMDKVYEIVYAAVPALKNCLQLTSSSSIKTAN